MEVKMSSVHRDVNGDFRVIAVSENGQRVQLPGKIAGDERPPLLADFVAYMAEQGYTPTRALPDEHTRMDEHGYTLGFWRKQPDPGEEIAAAIKSSASAPKTASQPAPTVKTIPVSKFF